MQFNLLNAVVNKLECWIQFNLTTPTLCLVGYLLMRLAFKSYLGDAVRAACSGGDKASVEHTHVRLPHHDVDEPTGIAGGSGGLKGRGLHEMVPLYTRI